MSDSNAPIVAPLTRTEYQQLSLRTAPAFVQRYLTPIQDFLLHGVIGLTTEIAEIIEDKANTENVLQEIGDVTWYLALVCSGLGISVDDLPGGIHILDGDEVYDTLIKHSGIANDCVKRHIYYSTPEKPLALDEDKLQKSLGEILTALSFLSGGRLHEAMQLNVDKLRVRYPDKFNTDDAVNRDVATEEQLFAGKTA